MFDVIVVGGGHAGTEAASASARRGARTALITFDRGQLGALSCNPSIGGVGKGHLVRELDAFDGLMARVADRSSIHHRMLNRSKGTAVRGPRVQVDRALYARAIQRALSVNRGLTVIDGEVVALFLQEGRANGVRLADDSTIRGRSVVLATGTFLGARIFRGDERHEGGRTGERPATALAGQLRAAGLPMGRLKTGTPPRLDGRTIDWANLDEQPSDADQWTMSALPSPERLPQIACAITRTVPATHDVVRQNFGLSPLFTGAIDAPGPRYCPSIEDKVQRFGDRDSHQIFLEPEGLRDHVVYPNGLSTSLPTHIQQELLATIPGLRQVAISTPGYAVEYDFLDPRSLDAQLGLSAVPGVFCAGQINGTTGYEEAAAQGLIAGLNAAAAALDLTPVILDRASSYIGVMIDDLTLQGVTEPYRMLTARAEFRLSLRSDNAETRLGEAAKAAGCLSPARAEHQASRAGMCSAVRATLSSDHSASQLRARGANVSNDGARKTGLEWLRSADVALAHVAPDGVGDIPADVIDEVLEDSRYAPYVARQHDEALRLRNEEQIALPVIRFADVPGLSAEMVARLSEARPRSLAAAARVRGVTPAALSAVLLHTKRIAA